MCCEFVIQDYEVVNQVERNDQSIITVLQSNIIPLEKKIGKRKNIPKKTQVMDKPIYIFCGYSDLLDDNDSRFALYEDIWDKKGKFQEMIPRCKMDEFEKDKTIIYATEYVKADEIKKIFYDQLLNSKNYSIHDCVRNTIHKINELNYSRSQKMKENELLDRINELYASVKGKFINKDLLYHGNFIDILSETYLLPNQKVVQKERIQKNGGKNSVIVIAITEEDDYIITFQNRIKNKMIAEFPAGYIEQNETPVEAAKRELLEETGYTSDDFVIIDKAFTSPGIDDSITYIVLANHCVKAEQLDTFGTEFLNYALFSENELDYLVSNHIMDGAMNKLAYYNLIQQRGDDIKVYKKNQT